MTDKINLITLPYETQALEPVMSSTTLDYHYNHLAKGYVDRNNAGQDSNAAPAYLHNIFFEQFKSPAINPSFNPQPQPDLFGENEQYLTTEPTGILLEIINKIYNSFENFQHQFETIALSVQGSGWIYLDTAGRIKTIKDHTLIESLSQVMFLVDLWEHAWALDYKWDKTKYLNNLWKIINWEIINRRMLDYQKTVEQYATEAIAGLEQSV